MKPNVVYLLFCELYLPVGGENNMFEALMSCIKAKDRRESRALYLRHLPLARTKVLQAKKE